MSRMWISALVVICLVAGSGCRKASETLASKLAEKAIEKNGGGKAEVDISNGKVTVKTAKGEMIAAGAGASIPADFPKDVLILQNTKVLATIKVPDGFSVTLESKEMPDSIVAKYTAEMKSQGWSEQASINTGNGTMLAYSKEKESRSASIMVGKGDKTAQIVITVSQTGNSASAGGN